MPFADRDASGIGSLADPVRRRLYEFVSAQPEAVSREQAATAVGIPLHQAKFQLDRLESEGLLDSEYARLSGRSGPGAGRPSKLYRRAAREIAVSLPDREYQLAARLMADAIAESAATGAPVMDALRHRARDEGRSFVDRGKIPATTTAALRLAVEILTEHGYEPRQDGGRTVMANCPFHALVRAHTQLVCDMNHALICGVTDGLGPRRPHAELDPGPGRCCVVLTEG